MRTLLSRITPVAQMAISVVLVAFAIMGLANASHVAAKVVYGILIAVGLVLLATGERRRRTTNP